MVATISKSAQKKKRRAFPPARWDSGGVGIQAEERKKEMHHQRARPVVAAGVVDPAAPSSKRAKGLCGVKLSSTGKVSSTGLLPLTPAFVLGDLGDPKFYQKINDFPITEKSTKLCKMYPKASQSLQKGYQKVTFGRLFGGRDGKRKTLFGLRRHERIACPAPPRDLHFR